MKVKGIVSIIIIYTMLAVLPAYANRTAIIPAYAFVSSMRSSMRDYQEFVENQNRAGARKLLRSEKVFIAPKDVRVEVVTIEEKIAKVKLCRLNEKAEPVTMYFWTLADQLKWWP